MGKGFQASMRTGKETAFTLPPFQVTLSLLHSLLLGKDHHWGQESEGAVARGRLVVEEQALLGLSSEPFES